VPLELVLEGLYQERPATVEMMIDGRLCEVVPVDLNTVRLVRLLQCELDDYLNPLFTPGKTIRFSAGMVQDDTENNMV
jgi:hypothetical protein